MASAIRLFVDHPLREGQRVPLTRDQVHYLTHVMRQPVGAEVFVFNGKDGEWAVLLDEVGKRSGVLAVTQQTKPLMPPPDLWLLFAPIKKARTDFIVEKATELGVAQIIPVQTERTNSERIRRDRLQSHAVEAAEQCGGTYVPKVTELQKLSVVLDDWRADRALYFCDEELAGHGGVAFAERAPGEPAAILIGPEGGFTTGERERIGRIARPVSLGPRILRADTAAVAALALWQARQGDWM
ncbi:16S rRNA (uracil(1498)-N(3))-methyltransferase [Aestuariibius sp. 2305UL40-4]|uniref:16S rRNA (uracil(1498)-N(3))-methyltransferase n=1 Tax=Aestuariibius violaceus TaxID=3234132 RepID=UPI00345ED582